MNNPAKVRVLNVDISATGYDQVVRLCSNWVRQRRGAPEGSPSRTQPPRGRYVCVTSVHGIVTAFRNSVFRAHLNRADVATPDGMPVVWAMRSFGVRNQARVYGPTLMLKVCEEAAQHGHRVFLYGGRPDTLGSLNSNLVSRFPSLKVVGSVSPPFRPLTSEEDLAITRTIRDCNADIVFVGISTPKQEEWMAKHCEELPGIVMFGVGAAFDFHAGRVKQAPSWMQGAGLEWFHRLLMEPRRLWKRYLLETPQFLPLWALQKTGVGKYHYCSSQTPNPEVRARASSTLRASASRDTA